jgi:hypothetical protein
MRLCCRSEVLLQSSLALVPFLAGCAIDTDLTNIPVGGGASGAGGPAGAALVDPTAGSVEVPLNLEAVVVRFAHPIVWGQGQGEEGGLRVCDGPAGPVPTSRPVEVPCEGAACYRVELAADLPPGTACRVALPAGASDLDGNAIPPGVIGTFASGAVADETPPMLGGVSIALAGPCLAVSFATDEPVTATVVVRVDGLETSVAAGPGKTAFDVAIPLGELAPSAAASVVVGVLDRAGNAGALAPMAFETPPVLPPLAITEVLANPAGPEPAQEFVELQNVGVADVSLAGLRLADAKGADDLPAEIVAPGAYVIVAPSSYDPQQGQDAGPRFGTAILRVDTRLGSDGLSNGGEPVRLLLGETIVSSYGGWVDVAAGSWAGRAVHRLEGSTCDRPDAWSRLPLEPTPGAGPP